MREPRLHLTDCELLRRLMKWAPAGPITVRELAGVAHISKSKVDDLRRGHPYPSVTEVTASEIARALGVDVRVLFRPVSSVYADTDKGGDTTHGPE